MNLPLFRAVAASALVYTAAIAVMGREVLASLASAIAADAGDPVLVASILVWNARMVPWTDAWFDFPGFYPARDALTFSEHLLGVSPVFTPLYWMSGDAIAAYNLTLLAGYVLTGVSTFALVWRLTRSHAAAFLAGLAFAFAPYRAAQISHIQVGFVFWAPLALLGLHAYLETGRRRWLALFGAAWLLQGAANGYFLVFFSILVGFWILWFVVVPRRWRDLGLIAATLAVAVLPLAPVLLRFASAHARYGFSRGAEEIAAFSAEVDAVACASEHLVAWGWLTGVCEAEGQLFPGVSLVLLCLAGAMAAVAAAERRRANWAVPWPAGGLLAAAALLIGVSLARDVPPALRISASSVAKPLTQALVLLVLSLAWWVLVPRLLRRTAPTTVARARVAGAAVCGAAALMLTSAAVSVAIVGPWRWPPAGGESSRFALFASTLGLVVAVLGVAAGVVSRRAQPSVPAFYCVAALATWMLAWGPVPLRGGEPVLPQGPYAWLMLLPGIDGLRVPARFWMMTVLCLSVLGGIAVAAILRRVPARAAMGLVPLMAAGLLVDGWTKIPAAAILPPPPNPAVLAEHTVLTLPLGSNRDVDIAAQYFAVNGGWRSVNGFGGYEPMHYDLLRRAFAAGDPAMLEPFLARGDLHVVVAEPSNAEMKMVESYPGAERIGATPRWRQYRLPRLESRRPQVPDGRRLPLASTTASCSVELLPLATDRDLRTRWECGPQHPTQELTADLGAPSTVGAIVPALGVFPTDFPRRLRIETSLDGESWQMAWDGPVMPEFMDAAFQAPLANRMVLPFAPRDARFVRLRLMSSDDVWFWSIAELEIWSGSRAR